MLAKITSIKNYLNSLSNILVYLEENIDIEESGTWKQFPDDFVLLLKIYKDNKQATLFIKSTITKAKEEFDKGFVSLIGE